MTAVTQEQLQTILTDLNSKVKAQFDEHIKHIETIKTACQTMKTEYDTNQQRIDGLGATSNKSTMNMNGESMIFLATFNTPSKPSKVCRPELLASARQASNTMRTQEFNTHIFCPKLSQSFLKPNTTGKRGLMASKTIWQLTSPKR